MEITIELFGRMRTVEVTPEVAALFDQSKRKDRSLYREADTHWDDREFDEYIIATEGRLPHRETPEETACRHETMDEIMSVLEICTDSQRERFLLHALYDFSNAEIGRRCGCSKESVRESIEAVRKKFLKFF